MGAQGSKQYPFAETMLPLESGSVPLAWGGPSLSERGSPWEWSRTRRLPRLLFCNVGFHDSDGWPAVRYSTFRTVSLRTSKEFALEDNQFSAETREVVYSKPSIVFSERRLSVRLKRLRFPLPLDFPIAIGAASECNEGSSKSEAR
jgi:hypothetical protein